MKPIHVSGGIRFSQPRHHIGVPKERPVQRIAVRHPEPLTSLVIDMALIGQRRGGSPR